MSSPNPADTDGRSYCATGATFTSWLASTRISSIFQIVAYKTGVVEDINLFTLMILNYLRIGVRNLFRNKLYSVINIGGLAVGLAVCMTILLYVVHEHSYDRFHRDAQRIFLLDGTTKSMGQSLTAVFMNHVNAPMMQ